MRVMAAETVAGVLTHRQPKQRGRAPRVRMVEAPVEIVSARLAVDVEEEAAEEED